MLGEANGRFSQRPTTRQGIPSASCVLARMSREEGEGVITADISFGSITDEPEAIPDRYWIAEFPQRNLSPIIADGKAL